MNTDKMATISNIIYYSNQC